MSSANRVVTLDAGSEIYEACSVPISTQFCAAELRYALNDCAGAPEMLAVFVCELELSTTAVNVRFCSCRNVVTNTSETEITAIKNRINPFIILV